MRLVMRADGVVVRPGPDGEVPPVPPPPPCRYRGEPTGEVIRYPLGHPTLSLPVLACAMHERCVVGPMTRSAWSCYHCGEVEPEPARWDWEVVPGLPDPLPDAPPDPVLPDWHCRHAVRARHVKALHSFLACEMPPTPASWGDGIVTLGEGRYWPMLVVQLRMIRANNDFPVIVYYRPWAGDVCKEDVRHLDMIEFRPIPAAPGPRRRGGWEAKTLALVDCPFERVLWLDADAYPVAPFATLFDEVSPESPFAYWSDIHTQRFSVNWGMCGMPNHGGDGGVQGGHLLLHRPAAWRLLACANWLNQHSEYFYRAGFGDQDMWRIAIKLLGTPHHVLGQTEYHGEGTVVKHGEAPVVVHRINCKMWGETGDVRNDALPCESEAWGFRLPSKPAASPVASLPAPLGVVAAAARPASRLGECWYLPAQKAVLAKVCGLALDNDLAADLGCWTGTSTLVLADRFRAVLAIDRWRQVPGGPADYDEAEDAYGLFRERLSRFKNVMCLRMDHEDAIRLLDGPLDLVHLDGDHNYGPVLAQINWAKRVVRAGGVICGHDLDNPNTPGVRRAVEAALGTDWQHSEWVWWHVVKAAPDAGPKGGAR